jgi:hypothetical protein
LLVTTDLDCTWALDGKAQGALREGQPVTVEVSVGEHLVTAATVNGGKDRWKGTVEVKFLHKKIVHIELKAVRAARLQAPRGSAAGNPATSKTASAPAPTLEETLSWLASNLPALQVSGQASRRQDLGDGAFSDDQYSSTRGVTPGSLQSCNVTLNETTRNEVKSTLHYSTGTAPTNSVLHTNCSFQYTLSLGNITDSRPVRAQVKDLGFLGFESDTSEVWSVALAGRGSSVTQIGSCGGDTSYSDVTPSTGNTFQVNQSYPGISFYSRDKEIVERIARAFAHAAELCRAKEPF